MGQREVLIVLGIVLVALAARLWNLGGKSFWQDEGYTWELASPPLRQILTNTGETNPPLYYALQHVWMGLFGTSEIALRSLSVLGGLLAVGLMGWVGHLIGGRRLAWLVMALLAIIPIHVESSQTARMYSCFVAASLASYGCLLRWERTRRRGIAAAYVWSTVLMCYSHNYAIFNLVAQQSYMVWRIVKRQISLRQWLAVSTLVLLGYAPWLLVVAHQARHLDQQGFWIARPVIPSLFYTIAGFIGFSPHPGFVWFSLALAAFGLVGMPRLNDKWRGRHGTDTRQVDGQDDARPLLLLWLGCPILLPFLWSQVRTPIFLSRYAVAASPALYLLLGRGILKLPGRLAVLTAALVMGLVAAMGLRTFYGWEREQWRQATSAVTALSRPGDAILVSSPDYKAVFSYYYHANAPVETAALVIDESNRDKTDALLHGLAAGHKRLWVVLKSREKGRRLITDEFVALYPDAKPIYQQKFPGVLTLWLYGFELSSGEGTLR